MGSHARAVTLAFDIGGSKTHAVRADNGEIVAESIVGSANISSMGEAEAGRQLDAAIDNLGGAHGVDAVLAGSAGVDTDSAVQRLKTMLAERIPGAAVGVVHDTALILAAAGIEDGIALISGTGSVAWGRRAGIDARAGGWGHLLGDEGSGYWVAREVVRQALRDDDIGRPSTALTDRLISACGLRSVADLHDTFYARTDPHFWAARAHVVFDAVGDDRAGQIIDTAANALVALTITVAERLGSTGPVVLAGGQAVHQPALSNRVRDGLAARGIGDVRVLDVDPVIGAVRLTHELLDTRPTPL